MLVICNLDDVSEIELCYVDGWITSFMLQGQEQRYDVDYYEQCEHEKMLQNTPWIPSKPLKR